ncbi:MAG: hypothetical protein ACRCSP_04150 [Rhodoglobus sp.]
MTPTLQPADKAKEAFESLSIPSPCTLASLVTLVESMRDTRVTIRASRHLVGSGVCGLWYRDQEGNDIIRYAITTSAIYREQIILHELAHMILRHEGLTDPSRYMDDFFRTVPPSYRHRVMLRTQFRDEAEQAAEILADLLAAAIRSPVAEPLSFEKFFG